MTPGALADWLEAEADKHDADWLIVLCDCPDILTCPHPWPQRVAGEFHGRLLQAARYVRVLERMTRPEPVPKAHR
jgi:hypothetical protein